MEKWYCCFSYEIIQDRILLKSQKVHLQIEKKFVKPDKKTKDSGTQWLFILRELALCLEQHNFAVEGPTLINTIATTR
jgi:hypothetical protein